MHAICRHAMCIAMAALLLVHSVKAEPCAPINWLIREGLRCYTPALQSEGCVVSINHSVNNNGYSYYDDWNNFWTTYKNSCTNWPGSGKGTISLSGNKTVPVTLYWGTDHAWPSDLDSNAVGQLNFQYSSISGAMNPTTWYASIRVNWLRSASEVYPYAASRYNIAGTIMHECLHALGLGDHNDGVMGDFNIAYGAQTPTTQDIADIGCMYETPICDEEYSPVLFSSVRCESQANGGALLTVATHREDGSRALRVLRSVNYPTSYAQYQYAGSITLGHPYGGTYVWEDPGANAWYYAIEVEESDDTISAVLFVQKYGTETYSYGYPAPMIVSMRAQNAAGIQLPYWQRVASGESLPPTISASPVVCDVLIVCYGDFAMDLAAVADYWQGQGYRVRMVSCQASDSFSAVRGCITAHNQGHELDGVWLVGASASVPSYAGSYQLVPSEDEIYDYRYGDIDDDGVVEVPTGRLPAASRAQVVYYVNKELGYHRDTFWGGRKPKSLYGDAQVNIVPATHAANGEKYAWTPGQYAVAAAGNEVYDSLALQMDGDRVHGFLSTQTFEWQYGDDATYADAVWNRVSADLAQGRHLVFGVSYHNSETAPYGVIHGNKWQGRAKDPVEEFWILPECYSNSYGAQSRYGPEEPLSMPSYQYPVYELFVGQALAIVGSSGVAAHNVTGSVASKWADRILVEDPQLGHSRPLGRLGKEIVNDVRSEYPVMPEGLCNYCIFGDPMLFVRGLYDDAVVGVEPGQETSKPTLTMLPNPGNGRVVLKIGHVANEQVRVDLFDIAGRKVWGAVEKAGPQSDRTVVWSGVDRNGRTVASGKYLVRVAAGKEVLRGTMVYVK